MKQTRISHGCSSRKSALNSLPIGILSTHAALNRNLIGCFLFLAMASLIKTHFGDFNPFRTFRLNLFC